MKVMVKMGNLNGEEWLKMWSTVKIIEGLANSLMASKTMRYKLTGKAIEVQVIKIKAQIESVIGQME